MTRYVGIDPSTKTGLVILDEGGSVLHQQEITTTTKEDPQRFLNIAHSVLWEVYGDCKIFIEGFAYGAKGKGVSTQYGVGWTIRSKLIEKGMTYTEISPGALKKFASGKGNTKKDELVLPIYKKWGFESNSDNVRDAYVLSQIGRYLDGLETPLSYQEEVLKKVSG